MSAAPSDYYDTLVIELPSGLARSSDPSGAKVDVTNVLTIVNAASWDPSRAAEVEAARRPLVHGVLPAERGGVVRRAIAFAPGWAPPGGRSAITRERRSPSVGD